MPRVTSGAIPFVDGKRLEEKQKPSITLRFYSFDPPNNSLMTGRI